jgi:hypothetical protein
VQIVKHLKQIYIEINDDENEMSKHKIVSLFKLSMNTFDEMKLLKL